MLVLQERWGPLPEEDATTCTRTLVQALDKVKQIHASHESGRNGSDRCLIDMFQGSTARLIRQMRHRRGYGSQREILTSLHR